MACKSDQQLTQNTIAQCSVCSGNFASMSEMCWIMDRPVQKARISDWNLLHANIFFPQHYGEKYSMFTVPHLLNNFGKYYCADNILRERHF